MSASEPVRLNAEQYQAFVRSLDEPPAPNEKLKQLLASKSPWDELPYDPADDFACSLDVGYAHIRERMRNGGKGWVP